MVLASSNVMETFDFPPPPSDRIKKLKASLRKRRVKKQKTASSNQVTKNQGSTARSSHSFKQAPCLLKEDRETYSGESIELLSDVKSPNERSIDEILPSRMQAIE